MYLSLAVSVILFATWLLVYLLNLGERGNTIAGPVSLFVTIVALVCTLIIWLVDRHIIYIYSVPHWQKKLLTIAARLALMVLLFAGGMSLYSVLQASDIPITETVAVDGNKGMADNSEATITIPDPTRRTQLALIPKLVNPGLTGNCVGSAKLDFRLLKDGVVRQSVFALAPNQEVSFDLGGVVQTASVVATVQMRDSTCRVNLDIHEAVLFNDER